MLLATMSTPQTDPYPIKHRHSIVIKLACPLTIVTLLLNVIAFSAPYWKQGVGKFRGIGGHLHTGLWRTCFTAFVDLQTPPVTDCPDTNDFVRDGMKTGWVGAWRAFSILSLLAALGATILLLLYTFGSRALKHSIGPVFWGAVVETIAVAFGGLSLMVFGVKSSKEMELATSALSWAFGLAAASTALSGVSCLFMLAEFVDKTNYRKQKREFHRAQHVGARGEGAVVTTHFLEPRDEVFSPGARGGGGVPRRSIQRRPGPRAPRVDPNQHVFTSYPVWQAPETRPVHQLLSSDPNRQVSQVESVHQTLPSAPVWQPPGVGLGPIEDFPGSGLGGQVHTGSDLDDERTRTQMTSPPERGKQSGRKQSKTVTSPLANNSELPPVGIVPSIFCVERRDSPPLDTSQSDTQPVGEAKATFSNGVLSPGGAQGTYSELKGAPLKPLIHLPGLGADSGRQETGQIPPAPLKPANQLPPLRHVTLRKNRRKKAADTE